MAKRPAHVPQFGNWDANDQVPFTAVFDNARAGKGGGKIINPNDPEDNPSAFGLKSQDSLNSEESDHSIPTSYKPQHGVESGAPRRQFGDAPKRGSLGGGGGRENTGAEDSPNHQPYQGRLGNRPGSPFGDRKNPPEGGTTFPSAVPGKSRLRPGSRAEETPDRSAALPKFGAWDENDPSAGEGFTVIFNQARNEKKQGGPVRIPALQGESPANPSYSDGNSMPNSQQEKKHTLWSCCFWARE